MSKYTILYYTANRIPENFAAKVVDQLKYCAGDIPIISISQKPIDVGLNIHVADIGQSLQNIYYQVLTGAKRADTEYIICCEDDTFYVPEHFKFFPIDCGFAYNLNRWNLHVEKDLYTYRRRPVLSQCIARREAMIECLERRFALDNIPPKYCGEPGLFEKYLGLPRINYETFETKEPNLVVAHRHNTTGMKLQGKDAAPVYDLAPWGNGKVFIDNVYRPINVGKQAKVGKLPVTARSQHSYIKSIIINMDELSANRLDFAERGKRDSCKYFLEVYPPFIQKIAAGVRFDKATLLAEPYYQYLLKKLNPADRIPEYTRKGKRHCLKLMLDSIKLFDDIKTHGLKAPVDIWQDGGRLVLHRGGRRVEICKTLGYKTIPARMFKNKDTFRRFKPGCKILYGAIKADTIHNLAIRQFMKYRDKATDKYWVHGYTPIYDKEIGDLRGTAKKILEAGVFRGASILLWKEAFPGAKIYGLDKNTAVWKEMLSGVDGVKIMVGRQEDKGFLDKEVTPNAPFDIIIDDASHHPSAQMELFGNLWPSVTPGGVYVIEDLHWNYTESTTMMDYLKTFIDNLYKNPTVLSMSFYYNICFVRKR